LYVLKQDYEILKQVQDDQEIDFWIRMFEKQARACFSNIEDSPLLYNTPLGLRNV
jgi:hypothetical protein